jgi:general secretion pathway protein A
MDFPPAHETFFGFSEGPFSLTPDPKYYFRSRSHSRAFDALSAGIANRESVLLVTGDLGVGKTTLCRTFMDLLQCKTRVAMVGNALISPEDLLRMLLQDLGGVSKEDVSTGRLAGATRAWLNELLDAFLLRQDGSRSGVVLIVDEAQSLPPATVEQIIALASMDANRNKALQIVLAGQPAVGGGPGVPKAIDQLLTTRARLLSLERDECDRYISHRLAIAGGAGVVFDARAIDVIYALSGGVARLVNLLCVHGLQQAAAAQVSRVESGMIESAASAFELGRLRPKRFRWYGSQAR